MRVVLLTVSLACAVDVCEIHLGDDFFCNQRGSCEGLTDGAISCDEAHRVVGTMYGAKPMESKLGLLRQPVVVDVSDDIVEYPADLELSSEMSHSLDSVIKGIEMVNTELEAWAPRVVFMGERIGEVMRLTYDEIQILHGEIRGGEMYAFVSRALDGHPALKDFLYTVDRLVDVIMIMPDIRTNGWLPALIPYLHLANELTFRFTLESFQTMTIYPELLLTMSQYDPMYIEGGIWRFKVLGESKWRSQVIERFLLTMPANVEERSFAGERCSRSVEACHEAVSSLAKRVIDTRGVGRMLELADRLRVDSRFTEVVTIISKRVRQLSESVGWFYTHMVKSAGAPTMPLLVDLISVPLNERIGLLRRLPKNRVRSQWGLGDVIDTSNSEGFIDSVASTSPATMIPKLMTQIDARKMRTFIQEVLTPNLADDGLLKGDSPKNVGLAIGRMIGYGVGFKSQDIIGILAGRYDRSNWLDALFFGSEDVRRGVYEWFPYGFFERTFDVGELREILAFLR